MFLVSSFLRNVIYTTLSLIIQYFFICVWSLIIRFIKVRPCGRLTQPAWQAFEREGEGNQAARPLPLPLLTPATQATVPGFKIMGRFRSGHPFPALNTTSALTILVVVFILGFEGLFIRVYCIAIKSVTKSL